jgi:hypothetical protein
LRSVGAEIVDVRAERPDVVVLTAVLEENTGVAYSDWWSGWDGGPAGVSADPTGRGLSVNAVTFTYRPVR